ncbi:Penicillinase repressor [Polystyrenella longa]|uniref:Penicillinase repressor n=1 Tax=Polystyrenella longa TaxID=2528007 RepID=A0A518CT67_9PLAN|nr:BlaI/MecI/CopY family transcriptional regulator [Polystyrenella longa]QDU82423.1 Penicillinase repressor [Polystyrenella longa]
MSQLQLTKCELEVMDVVWALGKATVQNVVDKLERPLAYTTVMTTLKILDETRGVLRKEMCGRAYVYEAAVSREEVSRSMAGDLTNRLFGGSVKSLMLSLMDPKTISPDEIRELKEAISQLEEQC